MQKGVNMRIGSSYIGMESARNHSSYAAIRSSTVVMVGTKGLLAKPRSEGDAAKDGGTAGEKAWQKSDESSAEDKKEALRKKLNELSSYSEVKRIPYLKNDRDALSTVKDRCRQYLMTIFFGETRKWDYREIIRDAYANANPAGTGITETVYHQENYYYKEKEETSFSTVGTVRTEDGRSIRFNLNVEMSREFSAYYEENYTQIQTRMCDPLVINLEGNIAELRDQTFYFDIDADGTKDEISMLGQGSGYLALDKNGDGIINDGSELFGTKSGDGFADLAAYDSDGNGWIDENDEIWKKLLIWTKDEYGRDHCYKLSEKNVGAICLSNASTDFSLNGAGNIPNGRIRKTGIFLYENGMAGTVQHLDVAKHDNYV